MPWISAKGLYLSKLFQKSACAFVQHKIGFVQQMRFIVVSPVSGSDEWERGVAQARNKIILDQARALGLLGTAKDTRLSGRVPGGLIEAAKRRTHVTSDTELLELALSRLALDDDFGAKLVSRKGSVPATIDLAV